ncbi:hypothetical protein GOC16_08540 [Sinorhizobium meliloti]|nr:hypothetical protein [Sinorhizobium meliloti]
MTEASHVEFWDGKWHVCPGPRTGRPAEAVIVTVNDREAAEAIAKAINRAVEDATFRIVDPIANGLGPALAVERYSNRARTEIVYNSVSDAEKAFRHLSLAFGIAKDALTSPETEREAME